MAAQKAVPKTRNPEKEPLARFCAQVRCGGCISLLSLVSYTGRHPSLAPRLPEIQARIWSCGSNIILRPPRWSAPAPIVLFLHSSPAPSLPKISGTLRDRRLQELAAAALCQNAYGGKNRLLRM